MVAHFSTAGRWGDAESTIEKAPSGAEDYSLIFALQVNYAGHIWRWKLVQILNGVCFNWGVDDFVAVSKGDSSHC